MVWLKLMSSLAALSCGIAAIVVATLLVKGVLG
jgi:hypothetical protein